MTDIIFIPHNSSPGGIYVDRAKATIVSHCGYGRFEFDLTAAEIEELQAEDPETPVMGDEADLVFPGVGKGWVEEIKGLPSVEQLPATDCPWLYWCEIDGDDKMTMQW